MCDKIGYPSKARARQASKSMHNSFRVYQCRPCGGMWHVTSQKKYDRGSPIRINKDKYRTLRQVD